MLYTGNPYAAGAVQGAVTNSTRQGLKMLTGKQECFNFGSLLTDTAIGTALGALPGNKIKGITTGRGNYNSIYKQMSTKGLLGNINNPRTAGKMFGGKFIDSGGLNGIVVGGFVNTQTNPLP